MSKLELWTDRMVEEAIRLLVLCEKALAGKPDVDFVVRQVRKFLDEEV